MRAARMHVIITCISRMVHVWCALLHTVHTREFKFQFISKQIAFIVSVNYLVLFIFSDLNLLYCLKYIYVNQINYKVAIN